MNKTKNLMRYFGNITPIFYKNQHTFCKGYIKNRNVHNAFKKAFLVLKFNFLLPPESWYVKVIKWKGFIIRRKKWSLVWFLFCFLTNKKRLCFLNCAGSYKNGCRLSWQVWKISLLQQKIYLNRCHSSMKISLVLETLKIPLTI